MNQGRFGRWVLAALLSTTSATAAWAQDTTGETNPDDIVVTAQKRQQSTKDVPATVAVLGEDSWPAPG